MSIFPPPPLGHQAPRELKRKAEALESEEPESVPTLHIRPGSSGAVVPSGAPECALKLRLSNASLAQTKAANQALDEEGGPLAVEVAGLAREELNARYSARQDVTLHGRRTYWARDQGPARFLIAWLRQLGRWAILEAPEREDELERAAWQAFQLEQQSAHAWTWVRLLEPGRWLERRGQGWARAEVRVTPAAPPQMAALRPPLLDIRPVAADFAGFRRLELNARYGQRADLPLQGKPSYWDTSGRFFLYWQSSLRRWAICGKRALDTVRQGQCPGCACQLDPVHFTSSSRWVEHVEGRWVSVAVEVVAHPEEDAARAPEREAQ